MINFDDLIFNNTCAYIEGEIISIPENHKIDGYKLSFILYLISETKELPANTRCKVYCSFSKSIKSYYSTAPLKPEGIYLVLAEPEDFTYQHYNKIINDELELNNPYLVPCISKIKYYNNTEWTEASPLLACGLQGIDVKYEIMKPLTLKNHG